MKKIFDEDKKMLDQLIEEKLYAASDEDWFAANEKYQELKKVTDKGGAAYNLAQKMFTKFDDEKNRVDGIAEKKRLAKVKSDAYAKRKEDIKKEAAKTTGIAKASTDAKKLVTDAEKILVDFKDDKTNAKYVAAIKLLDTCSANCGKGSEVAGLRALYTTAEKANTDLVADIKALQTTQDDEEAQINKDAQQAAIDGAGAAKKAYEKV